jgi:cyclomaltodextrinase
MCDVEPGKYRHFKGGLYEVVGEATHTETLDKLVIYRALYGEGQVWARPLSMWNDTVEQDGQTVARFTRLVEKEGQIQ